MVKRSDAATTGYNNTYGLCGLFCCVGSSVTDELCGVLHHSIPITYTVWTLCWALIGMQHFNLEIHNPEKENPNISVAQNGKKKSCDEVCLQWTHRAVTAYYSARVCTCYHIGYPLLWQSRHGCFLSSEDTNVRHVFLTCEQCSFSLIYGQIYAFIWGHKIVRIIYCKFWTVDGTFVVSKYLLSVWNRQFCMQIPSLNVNQFSLKKFHRLVTTS